MTIGSFIQKSFKHFFRKNKLKKKLKTVGNSSTVLSKTFNKLKKSADIFCILNRFRYFLKLIINQSNKVLLRLDELLQKQFVYNQKLVVKKHS